MDHAVVGQQGEGGVTRTAAELPTGDVTLLLSDIEGSTKRWEAHEKVMPEVVKRHDHILIDIIETYGGVDLRKKGEGDSHFAVFKSAARAAEAAVMIHRALALEDWGAVGSIRVRIALHSGEAELRDNDYYGQVVNRCARLRGVGHGGQTVLSEATKRLVAGHLLEGCALKDLGLHRLKDLLEPERVYQLNREGLDEKFPDLTSLSLAKHNLPVQLSSFVGRIEQLETVKRLLTKKRLVALLGAGGSGKTRLALQIGAEILDDYADGVWFIPLVGLQDPKLVAQAMAEALPISIKGMEPLAAIIDNYSDAHALFIVDNCEHLDRGPAEVINSLLKACPQLKILATSREPLRVKGEFDYLVPTMDCDLHGAVANIEAVARLESVELFRERAKGRLSDQDVLTDETSEDVAGLVKKLDGLPLALEQAAANLPYMSPGEILDRLEKHFAMFEIDEVGVEDRHRTIQATIDWSYSRLSQEEKHLFVSLSIFIGGWTREAAELVCCDSLVPTAKVGEVLAKLVDRSLVISERPEGWKINRFRMLEPIRQYAETRRCADEVDYLSHRHIDFFYGLTHDAKAAGLEFQDGKYLKLLTADHGNIRLALRRSVECKDVRGISICIAMYRFWLDQGHASEGVSWFTQSLNASENAPVTLRAEAMLLLGVLQWQSAELELAERSLTESRDLYEAASDSSGKAKAIANLANIASVRGDFTAAVEQYKMLAEVFREKGDKGLLAPTLENLGVSETKLDRLEDARSHLEEAVEIRRTLGAKARLAKALDSLLGVYAMQGTLLEHRGLFLEAAGLATDCPDPFTLENMVELAAHFCLSGGNLELAARCVGAFSDSMERSYRFVAPSAEDLRSTLTANIQGSMELKAFRRLQRAGRAEGCLPVLQDVCTFISNNLNIPCIT